MKIWKKFGKQSRVSRAEKKVPAISTIAIFGYADTREDQRLYKSVVEVTKGLAEAGYTVVDGGGPGVMRAATVGAKMGGGKVIGVIPRILVGWEHQHDGITELLVVDDMHVRKRKMYELCDAALILPGGFGTLDELFEALTLIQTGKIARFPIILAGKSYWQGVYDWIVSTMLENANINKEDLELFKIADSADEVVKYINDFYSKYLLKPNF